MRFGYLMAALLCACNPGTVVVGGAGGGTGGSGGSGGFGGSGGSAGSGTGGGSSGTGGGSSDGCSDEAKTVYVVAADRTFSAFDPKTKAFRDIGVLDCAAQQGASPFSMAVARDANAYVLYDSGELFKVATSNLACTPTAFMPGPVYRRFGMGFSTDTVNGTTDTLFIAGGLLVDNTSKLGTLDVSSYAATPRGDIVGWPELTGTSDAQLWGFFPQTNPQNAPFVARIDKATGAFSTTWPAMDLEGVPEGWAFAFWGGSFWIFLKRDVDASTQVWEMKSGSGAVTNALSATGRTIVGAGVSTCAPLVIN